jgi:glycosyltransferase involved in cell wall biosynthesis
MNVTGSLVNKAIVIVAGRNVSGTIDGCLESILTQDYPDLGVVFIDDGSTDDTLMKARLKLNGRMVITHDKSQGRLSCWKKSIGQCSNTSSVVFLVNPEGKLMGKDAISSMMRIHTDFDVVWSQHETTDGVMGHCSDIPEGARKGWWGASHLLSFKKFLFDGIGPDDLKYDAAEEMAVLFPMAEMATPARCYFLDRVLYRYAVRKMSREEATKIVLYEAKIRSQTPYGLWQSTTFVIPCFNQAALLNHSLIDVLSQNVGFKVIIVDDGSTDNTPEVCDILTKKYPTIVSYIRQEHLGVPAAKNAGVRAAKTNFVVPFSLGDSFTHNWLSQCFFSMKRNVDIVYPHHIDNTHGLLIVPDMSEEGLRRYGYALGCAMIRKTAWEKTGGWLEEKDELESNWSFWMACHKKGLKLAVGTSPVVIPDISRIRMRTKKEYTYQDAKLRFLSVILIADKYDESIEMALESCYYQSTQPAEVIIASGDVSDQAVQWEGKLPESKYPFHLSHIRRSGDSHLAVGEAILNAKSDRILFITRDQVYSSRSFSFHANVLPQVIAFGVSKRGRRVNLADVSRIDQLIVAGSSWPSNSDTIDIWNGNVSLSREVCLSMIDADGRLDRDKMASHFTDRDSAVEWMSEAVAYTGFL